VLVQEKLDESRMHDICISEIASAALRIEEKNSTHTDLERQQVQVSLAITQTSAEIESVKSEITAIQESLNQTKEERQKQHAEYREEVKDQEAVMALLNDAINIMSTFYDKPAFLQLRQEPEATPEEAMPEEAMPEEAMPASASNETEASNETAAPTFPVMNETAPEFAKTSSHDSSKGVMSILQILYEEAEGMIAQVVQAEEDAQKAFTSEVNSLTRSIELKKRELVTLEANHGTQTLHLTEIEESISAVLLEIEQLFTYQASVHAKCDLLIDYFTQNQESRDNEIQALREAKSFLLGKVETGGSFLQRKQRGA